MRRAFSERERTLALSALESGATFNEAAQLVGAKSSTVRSWQREAAHAGTVTKMGNGLVYFITDGTNTKIGFTTRSPEQRVRDFQPGNAAPLTVIYAFPGNLRIEDDARNVAIEKGFASVRGEWVKGVVPLSVAKSIGEVVGL